MIGQKMLQAVLKDQRREFRLLEGTVQREMAKSLMRARSTSAVIVKGVRRCGKSTMLKQLVTQKFGDRFYYVDFDDERLIGFEAPDFQQLMEASTELFGEQNNVILDEVQNISGWELFVNRLLRQGYSVFITGSNADLLSQELGTHLTGRHVDFELYPFSFREYLALKKVLADGRGAYSTPERAALRKEFMEYLRFGGMPEPCVTGNRALLGQLVDDIMQKDIIKRYSVRKPKELRSVMRFLICNASNRITFESASHNFSVNPNTVQKYIAYAVDACLLFTASKYDRKIKQFDKNPRKIYCVDNGIVTRHLAGMSDNDGALLENLVAVELKRRGRQFHYYVNMGGSEVDFLVLAGDGGKEVALQVCSDPSDSMTRQREEKALLSTLEERSLKGGKVITLDHEETKKVKGRTISYIPAWKWLLADEG